MNPKLKKGLIAAAKILIVLAVLGWVGWELYKSWNKIHELTWKPDYFWLVAAGVFYIVAYIPAAFFWRFSMESLGQRPGLYETFRAYYIGHLGKYIPGKAFVVILRSGLLNSERTRPSVAAAAVFLETLTMMATGAFLSALIIIIWYRDMENGGWLVLLAVGMMLVSGLPVFPPIFRAAAKRLGVGRNDPEIGQKLQGLNFRTLVVGWALTTFGWFLLGLSLWATIRGIGIETGPLAEGLPRFTLAASLSVVLGFVMMIPAGVGVREFALILVLTPCFIDILLTGSSSFGSENMTYEAAKEIATLQAIVIAGLQRGISILAELTVSALMLKKL